MPFFVQTWIQSLVKERRRRSNRRGRWAQETLVRQLRVTRLEERRVLNADAAPVQQLFVDAAAAANDGNADTFHIEHVDSEIRISLNGQEVSRSTIGNSESISIRGSSDDDIFIADLHGGADLSDFNLRIDGGGGHDVLRLVGDQRANMVDHELSPANVGRVTIESSSGNATVSYQGVETVNDHLTASNRVFRTAGGEQSVTVDDAGVKDDGFSRLVARFSAAAGAEHTTSVTFTNPLESLEVATNSPTGGKHDTVEVKGLDGRFVGDLQVTGSSNDAFSLTGDVNLRSGDLRVTTGSIRIERDVTTHDASVGLQAEHEIFVGASATIRNDLGTTIFAATSIELDGRVVSHGGNAKLDSGSTGLTLVRGSVDVSQRDGLHIGGNVQILGAMVALDGARIDASGSSGGGVALIGGDYQGRNSSVRNATQTWVSANTVISANAEAKGSGGKIVVWANEITQFFGTITARGGLAGGKGGFVEVSGAEYLVYQGSTDLSAEYGETGTLLLDPATITIMGGSPPVGGNSFAGNVNLIPGSVLFAPLLDTAPLIVYESQIEAQSATANIVLEATQTITTAGDFVDNAVTLASNRDLTLRIRNASSDGSGAIDLTNSLDGNNLLFRTQGTGRITINGSAAGGAAGNIIAGRLQSDTGAIDVSTRNGTITFRGDVVTNSDLEFVTGGDITFERTVSAASLVIRVDADFNDNGLVDRGDYDVWKSTFGSSSDFRADGNGDHRIDVADYTVWRDALGQTTTVTLRDNVTTSGPLGVDLSAARIVLDGLTIETGGSGGARFNGPTELQANSVVNTAGGNVTFTNTLNGDTTHTRGLMIAAASGVVTFDGAVGSAANGVLGPVMVQSAGRVDVNSSFRALNLYVEAGAFDSTGAGIDTTGPGGGAGGDILVKTTGVLAAGPLTTAGGDVVLDTGVSLNIAAPINAAGGSVGLIARGDITQSTTGTISALGLGVRQAGTAAGDILLDLENVVAEFTASNAFSGGMITYRNANALIVNDVDIPGKDAITFTSPGGINTTHGDVFVDVGGTLDLKAVVDAGAGNVRLVASGNVTQSADGRILANRLGVRQQSNLAGHIELDDENSVTQFAAFNAFAGGTITYHDVNGLVVGKLDAVTKGTRTFSSTTGARTTSGEILLHVGGPLTITEEIRAGAATVRLESLGEISQSALGVITAGKLGVRQAGATGNILLDQGNDVEALAAFNAFATGTITFRDADDFDVVTVDGVTRGIRTFDPINGLETTGGDIFLVAGGSLDLNQPVLAVGREVRLVSSGNIRQTEFGFVSSELLGVRQESQIGGHIELFYENLITRLAAENRFTAGMITIRDARQLVVDRAASVTKGGLLFTDTIGVKTANGDIYLDTEDALDLDRRVDAGTADVRLVARGEIEQAPLGTISAHRLGVRQLSNSSGNILLDRNNAVDLFAAENLFATGTIVFHDVNDLIVDSVGEVKKDPLIFPSTEYVKSANGDIHLDVGGSLTLNAPVNAGSADVGLVVHGNVTQTLPGTITAAGLALMVDGTTTLELGNDVDRLAANTNGTILFNDIDDLTVGIVTVLDGATQMQLSGITTSNDDVKLIVGDAPGESLAIQQAIALGLGDLFLDVAGNVTQTLPGTITAAGLALMVDGTTTLELGNDVDRLAANTNGTILFNDVDDLTVGIVTVLDGTVHQMQLSGITTSNDDVKLIVGDAPGESLAIQQAIALGLGDLFLDVAGNVTQTLPGTITAAGLALMVDGTTTLELGNDVDRLAANTNGTILFNDIDDLTVGIVTVLDGATQMQLSGITTSNDDVKLIVGDAPGESLAIQQAIALGLGDLFLDVAGNVTQTLPGTITAAGLALMVDGTTTLELGNDVDRLAAYTGDTIEFKDIDDLTVGTVTVLDGTTQMQLSGITTSNDDVKLIVGDAPGESLAIQQAIALGLGDLFLDVAGNVTQTLPGTITAAGLALMVDGTTTLELGNDVDRLAANTNGTILFNDIDDLTVGIVTVLDGATQMQLSGITTSNDDVKLIVGDAPGESLAIQQAIALGLGDLFLDVAGNVTQTLPGTITAAGLALMVDGTTTLELGNDVDRLAANTNGTILFNDIDDLTVGIVTVLDGATQMQLSGITTSNDDVKLIVGDAPGESLAIQQAIALGLGDLFLDVAGNVTQTLPGTITAAGLALMVDGTTTLELGNDVDRLAANTNGTILFNDVDDLTVGIVTVLDGTVHQMQLSGITTSNDDVKLIVGDAPGESLAIQQAIALGLGDLFLDVAGNVTQTLPGTITAAGLALMVDGTTTLELGNDVDRLAANTNGTILFNDIDDLTVGIVTVLDGATQMQLSGITTSNDDVKLIVGDAPGESLAIQQAIALGLGDLFLDVAGNVTQTLPGTITAAGLALMVDGTTTLELGNDVDRLAAYTGDTIEFKDIDDLTVGTVTVLDGTTQMQLSGIITNQRQLPGMMTQDVKIHAEGPLTVGNINGVDFEIRANDITLTAARIDLDGSTILAEDYIKDAVQDSGLITFHSPVLLKSSSIITANTSLEPPAVTERGGIKFLSTLTSKLNERNDLQLTANKGDILFERQVGPTNIADETGPLGVITIVTAHDVTAKSTIDATSMIQSAGTGTTHLMENVSMTARNAATISGPVDLTNANIKLDGLTISTIDGDVRMNAPTQIIANNAIATANGDITFLQTVLGTTMNADNLDLIAGTGAIRFDATVGSAALPLGTVIITSATNATAAKMFYAATADIRLVTGTALFGGGADIGTLKTAATLNNIGFRGRINSITNPVEFANYGIVTLGDGPDTLGNEDVITFKGGVKSSGSPSRMTNIFATIQTNSTLAEFGPTVLTGPARIDTTVGGTPPLSPVPLIRFADTLDSVPPNASSVGNPLTLNAGNLGDVEFVGKVGTAQELGTLTIANAHDVTGRSTIDAARLVQTTGSGLTKLMDDVTTDMEITLSNFDFVLHGTSLDKLRLGTTNAGGKVVLNAINPDANWTNSIRDALIVTRDGSISDQVLARRTNLSDPLFGAHTALEGSLWGPNNSPLQGGTGQTQIQVYVTDAGGSSFVVTIDWREGSPSVPTSTPQLVTQGVPNPAPQSVTFDHLYTSPPAGFGGGDDIPVYVSITKFANGMIQLKTASQDILEISSPNGTRSTVPNGILLNPDGSANGIQDIIIIDVVPSLVLSALPVAPPPRLTSAPPIVMASFETPSPPIAEAPDFAQSAAGVPSAPEDRIYELRIVTLDGQGREIETQSNRINLTKAEGEVASAASEADDAIFPFNPGKLRDLFRRLPDDHYRIYLIEKGAERLMLDFTIQQGRPVEIQDELESPNSNDTNEPGDSDMQREDGAALPTESLPDTTVPPPADGVLGESVRLEGDRRRLDSRPTTFAEQLGRAAFVAHGGLLLVAAARTPLSRAQLEDLADRRMARFGQRRRNTLDRVAAAPTTSL